MKFFLKTIFYILTIFTFNLFFSQAQENLQNITTVTESINRKVDFRVDNNKTLITQDKDIIKFDISFLDSVNLKESYGFILVISKMEEGKLIMKDQILTKNTDLKEEGNRILYEYSMPSFVKNNTGNYFAYFRIVNSAGMPAESFSPIKDFEIKNSDKKSEQKVMLPLDGALCQMQILGDISNKIYGLLQGPDIKSTETLAVNCRTANSVENGDYDLNYAISNRSYGTNSNLFFKSKKITVNDNVLSFDIKPDQNPQAYDYVFYLSKEGARVTPYIQSHYVVQGESATLHSVGQTLEKLVLKVTSRLTGSATNFPGSRVGTSTQSNTIETQILDINKNILYKNEKQENISNEEMFESVSTFNLKNKLEVKYIKVIIYSSDNKILSTKEVEINYEENTAVKENINNKNIYLGASIFIFFVIIILFYLYKRNKSQDVKTDIVASFLILGMIIPITYNSYAQEGSASLVAGSYDTKIIRTSFAAAVQVSRITDHGSYIFTSPEDLDYFMISYCTNAFLEFPNFTLYLKQKLNNNIIRDSTLLFNYKANYYFYSYPPAYISKDALSTGNNIVDMEYKYFILDYATELPISEFSFVHRFNISKPSIILPPVVNIRFE